MVDSDTKDRVMAVFRKNKRVGEMEIDLDTSFEQLEFDSLPPQA